MTGFMLQPRPRLPREHAHPKRFRPTRSAAMPSDSPPLFPPTQTIRNEAYWPPMDSLPVNREAIAAIRAALLAVSRLSATAERRAPFIGDGRRGTDGICAGNAAARQWLG